MTVTEMPGAVRPGPARQGRGTLVLSGWSAISAYGVGRDALAEGVRSGHSAVIDPAQPVVVPGFDVVEQLGGKGTRRMTRSTAFVATAIGALLRELGPEVTRDPAQIGLVLGVGQGNVDVTMDFTRTALTGSKPYHVDAMRFPDTFLNRAAGHSAIWHHLKGPNTTLAGGRLSALLALSYATRLYRGGHCPRLLVGATEEYSDARALLAEAAARRHGRTPTLGEGCMVTLLESADDAAAAGHVPVATVLSTHFRASPVPADGAADLAACVRSALAKAGADASQITLVVPLGELAEPEDAGIREVIGESGAHWLRCRPLLGDSFAASAGLNLCAALAVGQYWPEHGDLALVTGIDQDGTVGCALLGRPA